MFSSFLFPQTKTWLREQPQNPTAQLHSLQRKVFWEKKPTVTRTFYWENSAYGATIQKLPAAQNAFQT